MATAAGSSEIGMSAASAGSATPRAPAATGGGAPCAVGTRAPGAAADDLLVFVVHKGELAPLAPVAAKLIAALNAQLGLDVTRVVPLLRLPKTTSGKVQRVSLEQAYVAGEFAAQMAELAQLREAAHPHADDPTGSLERRIKVIVDEALPGKRVEVTDNLFEIGASSLTLIQIHEQIDREFPGQIDLTELFDFPTVRELAAHLQSKLAATGGWPWL